jgi:peptidyl-prolyl cis-trans isomerase-like 4
MSLLLETSLGDIVIDLEVEACPKTCENFLKLCKVYYYNLNALFNGSFHPTSHHSCCLTLGYSVSKDFLAQAGDPTATGTGGESIWSFVASQNGGGDVPRYFVPEIVPRLKHTEKGTVSMAIAPTIEGQHAGGCGSQFFITLADGIEYLDGKHAVFGHVVEGLDTLDKINDVFVDQDGRPFKDIRIRHVVVLGACYPHPVEVAH